MSLHAWVELVTTIIMSDQNVSAETKEKLGGVAHGLLEEIESGLTPRAADFAGTCREIPHVYVDGVCAQCGKHKPQSR